MRPLLSFIPPLIVFVSVCSTLEFAKAADSLVDKNENCKEWAERGECDANPGYMRTNCEKSCDTYDKEMAKNDADIANIGSFYDLKAKDIDGNLISFEKFRGKVTIVVNVASQCGYTESHYRGLVALHKDLASTELVDILAFPCNQFGKQEPDECPVIKRFAESKGVEFQMMDKVDVNGPSAHPVYKYLKKQAGPSQITWNFATYFVISPGGKVSSHSGVEPEDLKDLALEMIDKEL